MKFSKTFSISLIKPFSFYFLRKKIFKLKRTKWKQLRKHIRFIVKCRKYQKKNRKFKFYKIKNKSDATHKLNGEELCLIRLYPVYESGLKMGQNIFSIPFS